MLTVIGYGYLPYDDALRHAAKIISGKDLNEILVMRDGITIDRHPGWHAILGFVHHLTGCNQDGLVVFSVAALFIMFCIIPFLFLNYPEAWLITLLITTLASITCVRRLFYGRPYIITDTVLLVLAFIWPKLRSRKFPYKVVSSLALLVALAVWTHGIWYLFILPVICFFLAREWHAGLNFSIAAVCGIILGGVFTGHPYLFLRDGIVHLMRVMGSNLPQRILVDELKPFGGDVLIVLVVCFLLIWRYARGAWNRKSVDNPIFILPD